MIRLILIRHGRSLANENRIFANISQSYPLTEQGELQAELAAARLSRFKVHRIYSSPIIRAMQTARIIADKLGLRVYRAPALVEYNVGIYEGQPYESGIEKKWELEAAWMRGEQRHVSLPDGETFNDIYRRYVPFIHRLIRNPRNKDKTLVLVGHGSTTQLMLPQVAGNLTYEFIMAHPLYNTAMVFLQTEPDGSLRCTQWINDPENAAGGTAV